jgi:hypothetical protein
MNGLLPARFWAAMLGALVSLPACQRESASKSDQGYPVPSASGLDGMQLSSARRVALESATAAMQRRDLERLKQLSIWVRNRAQVSILEPDDLAALELAIQCLEAVSASNDALASLDQLKSGKLKQPAQTLCRERARQ